MFSCIFAIPAAAFDLHLVSGDDRWRFGHDDLQAMSVVDMTTETPWTDSVDQYRGVTIETLLSAAGLTTEQRKLRLIALNDYAISTDVETLLDADALIVFERNGDLMPVRDYGPYWVLFPFSERPELSNRDIRNLSVWQLKTIEVLPLP
ncbi:MAG: hypothetical protein LAT62_03360 [Natronospirillum sp.]|uniref:hypothetical protein n=1 Tax=Natronospirillum sp. TaxID=2812955 RepID=UPI0026014F75|nr:hypothetical protein [Natronospirillum sp.]MCH8550948.1 hypothetical protein [Natronospirillum sp.]